MSVSKGYSPSHGIWLHSQRSIIEHVVCAHIIVISDVSPSVRVCACERVVVAALSRAYVALSRRLMQSQRHMHGVESITTHRLPVGDIWPCVWESLDAGAT